MADVYFGECACPHQMVLAPRFEGGDSASRDYNNCSVHDPGAKLVGMVATFWYDFKPAVDSCS